MALDLLVDEGLRSTVQLKALPGAGLRGCRHKDLSSGRWERRQGLDILFNLNRGAGGSLGARKGEGFKENKNTWSRSPGLGEKGVL